MKEEFNSIEETLRYYEKLLFKLEVGK